MLSRRGLLAALPFAPALRLLAQDDATFSTDVKVVNVFANVRDRKGAVVKGLTKDDFTLEEDGRKQNIRYFAQESNLPLTIGLLVDTSGSTRNVLPDERRAARQFLEQVLREDQDNAFLIHFDFEVELLQDLTSSRAQLEKGLAQMDTPQLTRRGPYGGQQGRWPGPGGGGRGRGAMGGGTKLYDAIFLAGDELMMKQKGRKALILLSDGEDQGSMMELDQALEAVQKADTLVYTILFEDPDAPPAFFRGGRGGRGEAGWRVMEDISRQTGGRYFEVTRKRSIDQIFAEIDEDLRNQYSLGFTSDSPDSADRFRKLKVSTKQRGLTVQAREGYFPSATASNATPASTARRRR